MFQVANRKAHLNVQIVEILKVPDPAKTRKLTTHCLIEMSNPVQLVVRLPGGDGGQVVEGFKVAAVPDVGPQPGQQAAALGQAIQHLHLSGSPLGKCVAGLQQVFIHLKGRASGYLYRKKGVTKGNMQCSGSGAGLDPVPNESVDPNNRNCNCKLEQQIWIAS
jgi:hypothetical protein